MKSRPSILIADADPVFLATYTGLLESPHTLGSLQWPGYPVHVVGTHEQLWEVLDRERPAVLILDIGLPGGDSREFMRRLRISSELRTTAVIMTYPDEPMDDHQHFGDMKLGIDARLFEPIEPRHVLGFLSRILSL